MPLAEFFPEVRPTPEQIAALPCGRCPVIRECAVFGEKFNCEGIWGGEFRSYRMVYSRKRRMAVEVPGAELTPEELAAEVKAHDQRLNEEIKQGRNRVG